MPMNNLTRLRLAACVTALGLSATETVQAETMLGFARDAASQRFLYTEVHEFNRNGEGEVQTATTRYYDAQGKELGRKSLDYRGNRFIPIYKLEMPAQRYSEGISSNADPVAMFKQDQGKDTRKSLPRDGALEAADSGFNHLLLDQLPQLRKGETVSFKLIVAGNADRYRFRARKLADVKVEQEAGIQLRVEPDSLLRLLVDPIEIVYDTKGTRLLSYVGVSNIIDPTTGQVHKKVSISYVGPPPPEARWPQRATASP
jgi:hypothetical protein